MNSEQHFAPIAALDLDPIKVKLMHKESGEGWSLAYVDAVEFEYRRFLYLVKQFPHEQVAPLFDVDVFWHYHILDTMKYAADCETVFGYFLHHFPYVGLRGEQDLEAHHRVSERMRELYEDTYGEEYIRREEPTHSADIGKAACALRSSVAWSVPTAKFACSGSTATPVSAALAVDGVTVDASALAAAMFYAVRPSLCRTA